MSWFGFSGKRIVTINKHIDKTPVNPEDLSTDQLRHSGGWWQRFYRSGGKSDPGFTAYFTPTEDWYFGYPGYTDVVQDPRKFLR